MNRPLLRLRALALRLVACLGSFALAAGAGELGLRLFLPQPISWLSIYEAADVLPYRLRPLADQMVDTGETTWRVWIDARGQRGAPGAAPSEEGRPFLLGLGDSFAFGHGVDFEDGLFAQLERELGGELALRNAAVPGYGPVQYRQVLERQPVDPDLAGVLVASFLGNDFHDCVWHKAGAITDGALGATRGRRYLLKKHSHLYRFLSARAHAFRVGRGDSDLGLNARLIARESWSEQPLAQAVPIFRAELERLRALCLERGVPLLVLLLPARVSVDDALLEATIAAGGPARRSRDRDLPTRTAATMCEELGLPWLDPCECLRSLDPPLYFQFDGHYRPETARALARWLAPHVRERFLGPTVPSPAPYERAPQ